MLVTKESTAKNKNLAVWQGRNGAEQIESLSLNETVSMHSMSKNFAFYRMRLTGRFYLLDVALTE